MSDFSEILKRTMPDLLPEQINGFCIYRDMLVDWNENRCNLTAITDSVQIAEKHFADSILPEGLIPQGAYCIDVGTGAGFPGIPLAIVRPDIRMVLVDSLKKRIDFLEELKKALGLNCTCIHARAEDAGRDDALRGKFDIALTRAVSQTNILLEWTSPFLKVGGTSLMYKSMSAVTELDECANALSILGLEAEIKNFSADWGDRCVICAKKIKKTPAAYPRRAGAAKKNPL